ncbi:MAG TPA: Ig-like domain-containing protein, partial [Solirubrobacterales bacterium]|nr:Ig-like domain-containing protein [Solirubrobacterales bacterium]
CQLAYNPISPGANGGDHELTAVYGGNDANGAIEAHEPSLGTTKVHVNAAGGGGGSDATASSLACPAGPLNVGDHANCTVTVEDTTPGSPQGSPTGKVSFSANPADVAFMGNAECELAGAGATVSCEVEFEATAATAAEQISAAYPGDDHHTGSSADAAPFEIKTGGGGGGSDATATTVNCEPTSVILGGASACTATVEDMANPGATPPTGEVKFESDGPGGFSHQSACELFPASGTKARCQIVYTPTEIGSGQHTIKASYEGDGGHARSEGETQVPLTILTANGGHRTATQLDCQPSSVFLGGASICTVTIKDTAAAAAEAPTGGVIFASDSPGSFKTGGCLLFAIGASESRCQVLYTPSAIGPDPSHTISAIYPGANGFEPSTGQAQIVVSPPNGGHPTKTTLTCTPQDLPAGTSTRCKALVENTDGSTAPPAGNVVFGTDNPGTFASGGCQLVVAADDGKASCELNYNPISPGENNGDHELTAVYGGNNASGAVEAHEPSLATTTVHVTAALHQTRTAVVCDPATSALQSAVHCTATVEDLAGGPATHPHGQVRFQSNARGAFSSGAACTLPDGAGPVASCELTYTSEAPGDHIVRASYQGNAGATVIHQASDGTTTLHIAAPAAIDPTQATLSCAPTSLLLGSAVSCTVTVSDTAAAPRIPTGTASFATDSPGAFPNGASCSLTGVGGGKASCQVNYAPSGVGNGTHKLTASYAGDAGHEKSQAVTEVQVGGPPNTFIKLVKKKKRKHGRVKISKRPVKLKFSSDQPGSSFQCKLDKRPFKPCRTPFKLAKVRKKGRHVLRVRAVNPQGTVDPTPAIYKWKVRKHVRHRR